MATTTPSDSPPAGASTRLLTMWAALAAVLLISLIGVTLAYVHGSNVQSCSQSALRKRSDLTDKRYAAEEHKVRAQKQAMKDLAARKTRLGFGEFQKSLNDYLRTTAVLDQQVKAHPLGAC